MDDLYTWHVTYRDGTTINEYDEAHPQGRGFADVDGAQVKTLVLSSPDVCASYRVDISQGALPVFFRRRRIEITPDGAGTQQTVHCIGWKESSAVYLFVWGDGSTLLTSDFQAV